MASVREWRIAVIADTHNRLPDHVVEAIRPADEIWHLGDVTSESIIHCLSALGPPLRVVRGNCDEDVDWPFEVTVELNSFRFRLIHIPPKIAPGGIDVLLHGHTHVPRDEKLGGVRFLNPGTVGRANKGAPASFAWLTVGKRLTWEVVRI
jgi:putative phosphoesterase